MTEEFLHYLWKHRLLPPDLKSTSNEDLTIINPGIHNHDAGPDFLNARIKIGPTLWAGNVEIHVNSSDWFRHNHHTDKAYDNVILHFVYNNNRDTNREIPALELGNRYDPQLFEKYLDFMNSESRIPCKKLLTQVDGFISDSYIERIGIERLEKRTSRIKQALKANQDNWDQAFFELLSRAFGFRKNGDAFEILAKSIPVKIIYKHSDNLLQLESLLFGQANLIHNKPSDKYNVLLLKEYQFLKGKYKLTPIDKHLWKFLRLRPMNFPTIRIAQLAALLYKNQPLFLKMIHAENLEQLTNNCDVKASNYWNTHYIREKESAYVEKKLGAGSAHLLLINTIIPFIFHYGKVREKQADIDRSIEFLKKLPPEKNKITAYWTETGIVPGNAFETQALLHLYEEYCNYKKCLNCTYGHYILKRRL